MYKLTELAQMFDLNLFRKIRGITTFCKKMRKTETFLLKNA